MTENQSSFNRIAALLKEAVVGFAGSVWDVVGDWIALTFFIGLGILSAGTILIVSIWIIQLAWAFLPLVISLLLTPFIVAAGIVALGGCFNLIDDHI